MIRREGKEAMVTVTRECARGRADSGSFVIDRIIQLINWSADRTPRFDSTRLDSTRDGC